MRKLIQEGECIPSFYGVAYRLDFGGQAVCYPVPLNWVVGQYWRFVWWLKSGPPESWLPTMAKVMEEAYDRGYRDGRESPPVKLVQERLSHANEYYSLPENDRRGSSPILNDVKAFW